MSSLKRQKVQLLRVRYAKAYLRALNERGFDGKELWLRSGQKISTLDDPESWMPIEELYRFLHVAQDATGYITLGLDAGIAKRQQHSEFSQLVLYAPTLYQSLSLICSNSQQEDTSARFRLLRDGSGYWMDFGSIDAPRAGVLQIESFRYTAILEIIRFAAGSDWLPTRLDLQSDAHPQLRESPYLSGVDVRFGERGLRILIPPLLLSQPIFDVPEVPLQRSRFAEQPLDFFDTLLEVVRYQVLAHRCQVEHTASVLGVSTRTLQRRLREHEVTYSKLLDRVRVETAQEWLKNPDRTIREIAEALDYRHSTHFSRAFRRVCGLSPREYRKYARS